MKNALTLVLATAALLGVAAASAMTSSGLAFADTRSAPSPSSHAG